MRKALVLLLALFVNADIARASEPAAPAASALLGTWKVDLRPTPDAAPYFQEFVVSKVNPDNTFEATFYGTPVSQARINTQWGAVRIAFVTADQSGLYNHSAVLRGSTLEGLTNATGRGFLSYWSATKP